VKKVRRSILGESSLTLTAQDADLLPPTSLRTASGTRKAQPRQLNSRSTTPRAFLHADSLLLHMEGANRNYNSDQLQKRAFPRIPCSIKALLRQLKSRRRYHPDAPFLPSPLTRLRDWPLLILTLLCLPSLSFLGARMFSRRA
jgi:hypothetical protein